MNAHQGRTELTRLESDLAARMEMLFRRCPELHGFSVQHGPSVNRERVAHDLQCGLLLADVAWHQPLNGDQAATLIGEISQELLALVDEQPDASALLLGRTFARVLN